ncbi:MAG: hypothetical protein ACXWO1_20025, partial [Isosphaeraceae bacterium]
YQYMRNWNRGYMEWAQRMRIRRFGDPVMIHIYSEVLQKFRLAAQGKWETLKKWAMTPGRRILPVGDYWRFSGAELKPVKTRPAH